MISPDFPRFARYIVVGLLNTGFGYLAFVGFLHLGGPLWLSVAGSTVSALAFNFVSYGKLVFAQTSLHLIPRYLIFYALLGSLNFVLLRLLDMSGIPPAWGQALLLPVLAVCGYLGFNHFVFGRSGRPVVDHDEC